MLDGVAKAEYLEHLSLLVAAMQLLLSDDITPEDIRFAHECLNKFYSQAKNLYGKNTCVHCNIVVFQMAVSTCRKLFLDDEHTHCETHRSVCSGLGSTLVLQLFPL